MTPIEIRQQETNEGVKVEMDSIVRIADAQGTMYRVCQHRSFVVKRSEINSLTKNIMLQTAEFIRDAYIMLTVGVANPNLMDGDGRPMHEKDEDQRTERERIVAMFS